MARDISQLHPKARELAAKLVAECAKKGLVIKITDCVRDTEEQADCVKRKTSSLQYPYSMHNWGVAFDFCRNDGKGAYFDDDGFFSKVGAVGRSLGLMWGGDWTSPVDKPHFQLKDWGTGTQTLQTLYGTPEKFKETWNSPFFESQSAAVPRTLKVGSRGLGVKVLQVCLGCEVDGIFGSITQSKVKQYQGAKGLEMDGIVGEKTWTALFGDL